MAKESCHFFSLQILLGYLTPCSPIPKTPLFCGTFLGHFPWTRSLDTFPIHVPLLHALYTFAIHTPWTHVRYASTSAPPRPVPWMRARAFEMLTDSTPLPAFKSLRSRIYDNLIGWSLDIRQPHWLGTWRSCKT